MSIEQQCSTAIILNSKYTVESLKELKKKKPKKPSTPSQIDLYKSDC